jgi:hypothetical protein
VIAADQLALTDPAQRQRGTTVRAKILQGRNLTITRPIKHHGIPADHAAQGLAVDFVRGTGNVPSVFGIQAGLQSKEGTSKL